MAMSTAMTRRTSPIRSAYDALATSTVPSAPSRVQRAELSAPGQNTERVALAQPMPSRQVMTLDSQRTADPIRTGSAQSIWKVTNRYPRVEIKSGQTLSGLSAKYGCRSGKSCAPTIWKAPPT